MAKQTGRTRTLTVRISPDRLAAANLVALATGRTVSSLAEHCIELYIRKNYPQAFEPGARVVTRIEEAPQAEAEDDMSMGYG